MDDKRVICNAKDLSPGSVSGMSLGHVSKTVVEDGVAYSYDLLGHLVHTQIVEDEEEMLGEHPQAKEYERISSLKDSGERRTFDTGAQRDRGKLKGRPDLRAVHALQRYDLHNEKGASKYEARNWEKGMPLSEFYNSAARHWEKLLAGYTDEDHAAAALWNVMHFIEIQHRIKMGVLPQELDDMPTTFSGIDPKW